MHFSFTDWIITQLSRWMLKNTSPAQTDYLCNFETVKNEIQIGDILLVQGRNRISAIIRHITESRWTHAALYIGKLNAIHDPEIRHLLIQHGNPDPNTQLIIESEIGLGTAIAPLTNYQNEHIRILRPYALTTTDALNVAAVAIQHLGRKYDVRHLLDLARLLFPWSLYPRRWRSSLFEHNALQPTKDICSSMIATAFESVDYPILPLIKQGYKNEIEFIRRNTRLFTPSDFDYSPYFNVIRYPQIPLIKVGSYHHLHWMSGVVSDDSGSDITFVSPELQQFFSSKAFAVVGASSNKTKFGNKVLCAYIQNNKVVFPINPHEDSIEGINTLPSIDALPNHVKSISIVTPPAVTEKMVVSAIQHGIKNIWMQPGSESESAIVMCKKNKINVIAGGPCILKELQFKEIVP